MNEAGFGKWACWFVFAISIIVTTVPGIAFASDQEIRALLTQIEQQLAAGQIISPVDDNAMATWKRVVDIQKIENNSPALNDFAARVRVRAVEERTAGKNVIASDMIVFAEQADRLIGNAPSPPPVIASIESPPRFEPLAAPLQTTPADPPTEKPAISSGDFYAARGDDMIAAGNLTAARKFYALGAKAGSARAASMSETLQQDPNIKAQLPPATPSRRRVASSRIVYQMPVAQRRLTWFERFIYDVRASFARHPLFQ
jgi:hypothetical protein